MYNTAVIVKNKQQRQAYQQLCQVSMDILYQLYQAAEVGIPTLELDDLAWQLCKHHGVKPSFFNVPGTKGAYQHAGCIYLNDVVVHGVPKAEAVIKSGDILTIDFGITDGQLVTDHCVSVGIGELSDHDTNLLKVGKQAVWQAVQSVKAGTPVGTLGHSMEQTARQGGFDTIKEYIGHGIGTTLHDEPEIPAWGQPGKGYQLRKNQVVCIEAQVVAGSTKLTTDADGWSVRTKDGHNAVMFEYMVLVGNGGPKVLTDTSTWPVVK